MLLSNTCLSSGIEALNQGETKRPDTKAYIVQNPKRSIISKGWTFILRITLATGWKVRGSNPTGGVRGHIPHPSRPALGPTLQWVPGLFPGVKRPGRGVNHPPPYSAEVKARVELYHYSPSEPSRPVLVWTLWWAVPNNLFPSDSPNKNLYAFIVASIRATCSALPVFLDLIILIIFS